MVAMGYDRMVGRTPKAEYRYSHVSALLQIVIACTQKRAQIIDGELGEFSQGKYSRVET